MTSDDAGYRAETGDLFSVSFVPRWFGSFGGGFWERGRELTTEGRSSDYPLPGLISA